MPQNDFLKRSMDAGMAFTQLTRARAEAIVKEWVKAGDIQREQAQERVDDLVERSRKNTEQFMETIRKEISRQLSTLGFATKDDLAKLEARLTKGAASRPAAKTTAKKAPAKSAPAKKASGAKTTAKKAASPAQPATPAGGAPTTPPAAPPAP